MHAHFMKRSCDDIDLALPWPIEAFCWGVGALSTPAGIWWFMYEITSPASALSDAFGIPIDLQSIVAPYRNWSIVFGIIVGVRISLALRRWFARRLASL